MGSESPSTMLKQQKPLCHSSATRQLVGVPCSRDPQRHQAGQYFHKCINFHLLLALYTYLLAIADDRALWSEALTILDNSSAENGFHLDPASEAVCFPAMLEDITKAFLPTFIPYSPIVLHSSSFLKKFQHLRLHPDKNC